MGWNRLLLLGILASLAGSLTEPAAAQEAAAPDPIDVAEALLAAFNAHDPDAMADLVTSTFELYYVGEDGQAELAVSGPGALRAEMAGYFETRPSVRSEHSHTIDGTRFVAFREQIVGGQSSLVVYEIEDTRVRRAWYYPAEPGH